MPRFFDFFKFIFCFCRMRKCRAIISFSHNIQWHDIRLKFSFLNFTISVFSRLCLKIKAISWKFLTNLAVYFFQIQMGKKSEKSSSWRYGDFREETLALVVPKMTAGQWQYDGLKWTWWIATVRGNIDWANG